MRRFFRDHPFLSALVGVLLIVALIISTVGNSNVTAGENLAGSIFSPIAGVGSSIMNGIGGFFGNLFNTTDVHAENEQLKEKILVLEGDNALLRELQLENARLKEISQYVEANDKYEMITARVSAKNPGYWFDSFIINAGRNQGLTPDMPVITTKGLVGRVVEVGGNWAKVMSIIDARSAVSGIVERTRDTGIVRGVVQTGTTSVCSMSYLPFDSDLVPGDKILTSGLGGVFPKGLVIGEVGEVSLSSEKNERTATINPAVSFAKLEEVMVITKVFEQVSP